MRVILYTIAYTIILPYVIGFHASIIASLSSNYHGTNRCDHCSALLSSSSPNHNSDNIIENNENSKETKIGSTIGIRLNKVFKATHSRRAADALIASGRVSVNGKSVTTGFMVKPYQDAIALDGKIVQGWEKMNAIEKRSPGNLTCNNVHAKIDVNQFEYVKYYKPLGIICTTDKRIRGNIITSIQQDGFKPRHRIYPVGRLDKDTSGIIILTSDGRLVNTALRGENKQPKVYNVFVNDTLYDEHLQRLRDGVVIRTISQRKGRTGAENTLIAKTRRCKVERLGQNSCQITLVEGRNRQIRKMMEGIGFRVTQLQRIQFLGIPLTGGSNGLNLPGDWAVIDHHELQLLQQAMNPNV